jgi:hypothetical protein
MDEILKSIEDEDKRKQAEDLAKAKGWPAGLAAVAVLSDRDDAAGIIDNALNNAAALSAAEAENANADEIARLQQEIARARQNQDFKTMITLKSRLHDCYGIGSL